MFTGSRANDIPIVWIDTELTGLDVENSQILEIACLITNSYLNVIAEEFSVIIRQPESVLQNMNEWCTTHHNQTGLVEESRKSRTSLKDAEQLLLNYLKSHVPPKVCPMAGNTVYMDRIFIQKHMPQVEEYLHYRIIDVSSVKELVRRWRPVIYRTQPKKQLCHRALDDIKESIAELRHYKEKLFHCCGH